MSGRCDSGDCTTDCADLAARTAVLEMAGPATCRLAAALAVVVPSEADFATTVRQSMSQNTSVGSCC